MSIFNDKGLKSVAEAAAKIMEAQKLAKQDYDKDGKVESPKAEVLGSRIRAAKAAGKMKEEVEQLDELSKKTLGSYAKKAVGDYAETSRQEGEGGSTRSGSQRMDKRERGIDRAISKLASKKTNEEVELDEAFPSVEDAKKRMAAGKTSTGTVTKTKTGLVHKRDYKDDDNDADDAPKKSKGYGARQNYKRSTRVNESLSFTEMLELYNEHGLKVLSPVQSEEEQIGDETVQVFDADKINGVVETVVEEVDNETFTKEVADQKASADGKKKQPPVAAGKTIGVKNMPESVELEEEQLDELSKTTLGSYARKASSAMAANALHSGYVRGSDTGHNLAVGKRGKQKDNSKLASKSHTEMKKREAGLGKAISRLAKEETEQLDEVAPPGREKQVKALKKVPGIDNPWAVSWASYRKSHPKKG